MTANPVFDWDSVIEDQKNKARKDAAVEPPRKWNVMKNLALLVLSNFCAATTIETYSNAVTSIDVQEGIGHASFSALGILQCLVCFVTPFLLECWGSKTCIIIGAWCVFTFIPANFYRMSWTMIPAGILFGIGSSLQWISINQFTQELSESIILAFPCLDLNLLLMRMFGAITFAYQAGLVLGGTIFYFAINPDSLKNSTASINNTELQYCGSNYCNEDLSEFENLRRPEEWRMRLLLGIFTVILGVGTVMCHFMDSFTNPSIKTKFTLENLKISLKKLSFFVMDRRAILLMPFSFYIGIEETFIFSEFTEAYVSCGVGIEKIGFVTIIYGALVGIMSLLQEAIIKKFGRIIVILLVSILHIGTLVLLIYWKPSMGPFYLYLISGIWGLVDAVVITEITAVYGIIFKDDSQQAFAHSVLVISFGYLMALNYTYFFCMIAKIYIIMASLLIAVICYLFLELDLNCKKLKN